MSNQLSNVSASQTVDLSLFSCQVIPRTLKEVFTDFLLDTYKYGQGGA